MRIVLAAALALSLAGFVSACGGSDDLSGIDEGQSFELNGLRYNVVYDRFLNPAQTEDSQYLKGLPAPPQGKAYYSVFILVKNDGNDTITLPNQGDITMTDTVQPQDTFTPIDNSATDYGFPFGQTLAKDDEVPDPDSIAASGPTEGSLVLFLVDQGVTENRPLDLHIDNQGPEDATVKLDV
jgi:hypothetical protein